MKLSYYSIISLCTLFLLTGCNTSQPAQFKQTDIITPSEKQAVSSEVGIATYYANKFNGRKTASGAIFDNKKLTAAHRSLPFGTQVRVTALWNNQSVIVTINDRGPFSKGYIIDVSKAAAAKIGLINKGVGKVKIEVLK
ncbi:hypothetical protein BMT54_07445 [Pasteurellaceae bacterium 15-036681]|nr:hypothetical protein BMT54_07445 [Pasteurellaceae bacterium 15-036681]